VRGPIKETIYVDPATGLMRATQVQEWDTTGEKLIREESSEFEYTETNSLPDSLFDVNSLIGSDATEEP